MLSNEFEGNQHFPKNQEKAASEQRLSLFAKTGSGDVGGSWWKQYGTSTGLNPQIYTFGQAENSCTRGRGGSVF